MVDLIILAQKLRAAHANGIQMTMPLLTSKQISMLSTMLA